MLDSTDNDGVSMTDDLNSEETGISTSSLKQQKKIEPIMMASFRVDREVWAKFGAIAKRERLTATDVLTEYIQRCTDNDKTEYAVRTDKDNALSTDTYDTDKFHEAVRMAVSTLSLIGKDDVSAMISTKVTALESEMSILSELNKKTLLELSYQKGEIDAIDNRVSILIESATSELVKTSTVEELVKVNIDPLADLLAELEADTRSELTAVRDELRAIGDRATTEPIANPAQNLTKPNIDDDVHETEPIDSPQNTDSDTPSDRVTTELIANPTTTKPDKATEKDPNIKPWTEFFKMVGIAAMTATEALRKQDKHNDIRAQQIQLGIQAAREKGLGEWAINVVGRSFVRVTPHH